MCLQMQQVLHHRVKYVATLQCVSTVAQNHPGHSICKPQVHPRFDIYTKGISHSYDTLIYYLKQQKLRSGCFFVFRTPPGETCLGRCFCPDQNYFHSTFHAWLCQPQQVIIFFLTLIKWFLCVNLTLWQERKEKFRPNNHKDELN